MPETPTSLEDGWQPTTPSRDSIMRDFVDSSTAYLTSVGRAVGATVVDDVDFAGAHHGAPFPFVNMVVVRRPIPDADWPEQMARIRAGFPGGQPFVITSPFPTPDLRPLGFTLLGHPPFMMRPAGPPVDRPTPVGIRIRPVTDSESLAAFERTLIEAYPAGPSGSMFHPAILQVPGVTLWLATIDERPVATAATHHAGAVNGVELVSCRSDVRGRGIGAAITWSATLAAPDRPAALIASDSGHPVYNRMGYLSVTRFTLWVGA